ncbi:MAG: SRPBCC family protein [Kofleriaceae bacterium]
MRELASFSLDDFATAPFQYERTAVIAASPEAVFAELGDPSLWFGLMSRSVWKSGATSGVGAIREVTLHLFGSFREVMLAWDEPDARGAGRVAFTMTAADSPLVDRMAEEMRLEPHAKGVAFTYRVIAEPSRIGRPLQPVLRAILRGLFAASVRGLAKRTAWSEGRVRATQGA